MQTVSKKLLSKFLYYGKYEGNTDNTSKNKEMLLNNEYNSSALNVRI